MAQTDCRCSNCPEEKQKSEGISKLFAYIFRDCEAKADEHKLQVGPASTSARLQADGEALGFVVGLGVGDGSSGGALKSSLIFCSSASEASGPNKVMFEGCVGVRRLFVNSSCLYIVKEPGWSPQCPQ